MMKYGMLTIFCFLFMGQVLFAQSSGDYPEKKVKTEKKEFKFIGYYFMRGALSDIAPTNEFLKGQVVGRFFGGNSTATTNSLSSYVEQRFIPMITYSPRLFDGWAKMRMSFEFD